MGANKEKQNLRFRITSSRLHSKVRYDGFTKDELKFLKSQKAYDQFEKELNRFWKTAPRKENNNVDWKTMSDETLDYFEHITKQHDRLLKQIIKHEENGMNVEKVKHMFMMLNVNSASY